MAFGSDEIREAVLRARLERAELHIRALSAALYNATGMGVCQHCFRLKSTEHCGWCTGVEGQQHERA